MRRKTSEGYYFYITEKGDVVLGCETSPDAFFNKVIGNVSDIKNRKINLSDQLCSSLEVKDKVVKRTFFDLIMGILKVF